METSPHLSPAEASVKHPRIVTARRMGVLSLAIVVVVGAFFVRLVDIQVVRAAELSDESTQFRTQEATLWAERGQIVDRTGQALAHNADRYDVTARPCTSPTSGETAKPSP